MSILRAIYQSGLRAVSPPEVVDAMLLADTDLPIALEGQEREGILRKTSANSGSLDVRYSRPVTERWLTRTAQ